MATVVAAALVLVAVGLAISAVTVWRANRGLQQALDREREALGQKGEALDREQSITYFQRIALAERELAANHGARAEELLDQCRAELRGWEWHFLKRRMHEEPLALPGHTRYVAGVAFRADAQVLASASMDGTVRFWDLKSGRCRVHRLSGSPPGGYRIAFSPDGQRLAAGSRDGAVIWDLATNQRRLLMEHANRVEAMAFSPDGQHVAATSEDGTVIVWDLSHGEKRVLTGHGDLVHDVAYSPDGMRLASASEDQSVRVWDLRTGQPLLNLTEHQSGVLAVVFSPDGRSLATSGQDSTVRIWDATTGSRTQVFRGHGEGVGGKLAFSPDGRRLVSASDTTVRVWDPVTGQEALILRDHTRSVSALAFSRDGRRLASGSYVEGDPGLRVWNAMPLTDEDSPQASRNFAGHAGAVNGVAFSPDGNLLASGGDDRTVLVGRQPSIDG
jgi:WD40 repeat protein